MAISHRDLTRDQPRVAPGGLGVPEFPHGYTICNIECMCGVYIYINHMAPTWKMSLQGPLKKLMDDRSGDIRDYQSDAPLVFRSFPVPQVP